MDFDSRRGYELRVLSGAFEHRRILRADQTAGEIIAVWGVTGPVRLATNIPTQISAYSRKFENTGYNDTSQSCIIVITYNIEMDKMR